VNYTREQKLALVRDRHLAVTANAGSGKTSVLVEKYIDLLISSRHYNNSDAIRSIIAITFTRQAAADMKAKITRKISNILLDEKHTGAELQKLKHLRETISSAKVSTIHSFCNSLLREYPLEAGISPVFREMDEYESFNLSQFSVDSILEKYSEQLVDSNKQDIDNNDILLFGKLVDSLGINNLRDYMLSLLKEPVNIENYTNFYNQDTAELVNIYHSDFNKYFFKNAEKILLILSAAIETIDENIKNYGQANTIIARLNHLIDKKSEDRIDEIISGLKEIRTLKAKGNSIYSNLLIDSIYGKDTQDSKEYKNLLELITKTLSELVSFKIYSEDYIEQVKFFVKLVGQANEIYLQEKDELSAYTFDDLLILANNLLSDEAVRDRIIDGLDYLLVDEFQDTNQIQYDIVRKMVPSLKNSDAEKSPKVFIVGDAKQSIYGFRSADVSVFNEAGVDIQLSNQKKLDENQINKLVSIKEELYETNKLESTGIIALADSFRLLPAVAMFVNNCCENIFLKNSSGIGYEALICGRSVQKEISSNELLTPENGSISFIIAVKPQKKQSESLPATENDEIDEINEIELPNESEQVVNYIKHIISGNSEIKILKDEVYVAPEYKDIAILCRKKNSIQKLVPALISNKIPFSISSGKGFYQTQEVTDFISLLSVLINQNDDIHFSALLKSPLFNFSDSELIVISRQSGDNMYEKFQNYAPENDFEKMLTERTKSILVELIAISSRLSIAELLIRAIELTDYFGVIEKFEAREQIKSNIKQFINSASEFESKGYKSLYDFILRVQSLTENSSESEAAFISGENLISLMTVHGSKGLEFPVVIMFDTNSRNSNNSGLIKSKKNGISIPFKTVAKNSSDRDFLYKQETIPQKVIQLITNEDDNAEEARLLYVAMTRAKDHLIISTTVSKTKTSYSISKDSFAGLILNSLKIEIADLMENGEFRIGGKLKFTGKDELNLFQKIKLIPYKEYNLSDISSDYTTTESNQEVRKTNFMLDQEIEPGDKFDIVSATKITTYESDMESFTDRYVLGLPDLDKIYEYSNDEEENSADGTESGSIIHKILENINLWIDNARAGKFDKLDMIIDSVLFDFFNQDNQKLRERVKSECIAISQSDIIKQYSDYLLNSEFEKTLNMPFQGSILTGNIDLLIKGENDNIIEIWDWKSNKVSNEEDINRLGEHYLPQLKFYIFLISKIYPKKENIIGRLLFTRLAKTNNWVFTLNMTKEEINIFEEELRATINKLKVF
jgi:ATP-dependent helicase/nuclease subunit A